MTDTERIVELLGEYQERIAAGEPLDVESFVREHADVAEALREQLEFTPIVDAAFPPEPDLPEHVGAYGVLELLGVGGMGTVYRAESPTGSVVALKVVHPHLLQRAGFLERFQREAQLGRAVEHPNVVRTLDVDAQVENGDRLHVLVMEYVEGRTLADLLDELGHVPEELCRHIGRDVVQGLRAIHRAGAVHRDLKPENVIITPDHEVKVMDLGVARLVDESVQLSRTGQFLGSLEYAAPEQFGPSAADVDARCDLHALGLLLYELATGRHPFSADDTQIVIRRILEETPRRIGELNPQTSPFLEELVDFLLRKDPEGRPPSADAVLEILLQGEAGSWWRSRARALQAESRRPLRRVRIPRETALYGRDEAIQTLRTAYEHARARDGRVLLIEGEAGIGKTRLVDEFAARLQEDGEDVDILFGTHAPGGSSSALATACREHFGTHRLEEALTEALGETPSLVPAFAALLRGDLPPANEAALTLDSVRGAFTRVLRTVARHRTAIVIVDDLQFASEDGRALFAAVAHAVAGHRILLVGTQRPGVPAVWTSGIARLEHADMLAIDRLGPKDLARLLRDAFQSERLAEELAYRIATKSDGNPFFVFEIIRGLKEGQLLTQRPDGSWSTTSVLRDFEVPSSVQDLVSARVADLERAERDLLDLASCCGQVFDPLLVAEAAGEPALAVLQTLAGVEKRHRLVRSAGHRMTFDHHQVREALYGTMPPPLRQLYHLEIARALEARGAEPGDPVVVAICEHWKRGGDLARADPWLEAALDHLEGRWENERATNLLRALLEADGLLAGTRRIDLLLRLDGRLDLLVRRTEQEAVLREAVGLAEARGDADREGRARMALGNLLWRVGRLAEAEAEQERVIALARACGDVDREAAATINRGNVRLGRGRNDEAQVDQIRGLALARRCRNLRCEANATMNLGILEEDRSRYDHALEHHRETLGLAQRARDRLIEARAHGNVGRVARLVGDYEEAARHLARYRTIAREIGDRRGERVAGGNLAMLYLNRGRIDAAHEEFERVLALCRETGDRKAEAVAEGGLGNAAWRQGRLAEAIRRLRRELILTREFGKEWDLAVPTGNLGLALLSAGRTGEARRKVREALVLARKHAQARVESYQLHALGLVEIQAGDLEAAAGHLAEAHAVRKRIGYRKGVAETRFLQGRLAGLEGDEPRARALLAEAMAAADTLRIPNVQVLAATELAALGGGSDDARRRLEAQRSLLGSLECMDAAFALWRADGDAADLAEAHGHLRGVLEHAPEEDRKVMLREVPLYRDVDCAWDRNAQEA